MLDGGAAGASPSPPKTASSRAAGAGSGGGGAACGASRGSGVGVSSTLAKSFDAGVDIAAGDRDDERRGTMCEGTRGLRGGAGDGAGAAGGLSGLRLAVQLVSVSFWSLPRKLSLFVGLRAMMVTRVSQNLYPEPISLPKTLPASRWLP